MFIERVVFTRREKGKGFGLFGFDFDYCQIRLLGDRWKCPLCVAFFLLLSELPGDQIRIFEGGLEKKKMLT